MPIIRFFSPLFIAMAISLLVGCAGSLKTTLQQKGFSELSPPSTLVPPGTVVQVRDRKPLHVSVVCEKSSSLGDVPYLVSVSADSKVQGFSDRKFQMNIDYLKDLLGIKAKSIRSIDLDLTNVKLLEISTDAVFAAAKRNRTPTCQFAIDVLRRHGKVVSMVKAALQADVTYTVQFSNQAAIEPELRWEILNNLAAKLGAEVVQGKLYKLHGKELFWGIVDSQLLIEETVTAENSHPLSTRPQSHRAIPTRETVTVDPPK